MANVRVKDSAGSVATASKQFRVGVASTTAPAVPGTLPTTAVITEPSPDVFFAGDEGAAAAGATTAAGPLKVTLDATGSAAAVGAGVVSWMWGVVTMPGRTPVTSAEGEVAVVSLEPGQYQVRTTCLIQLV